MDNVSKAEQCLDEIVKSTCYLEKYLAEIIKERYPDEFGEDTKVHYKIPNCVEVETDVMKETMDIKDIFYM